jgi:hypothetical protein
VESVRRLLTEDRRTALQMIADCLNIGKETVRRIVTEDLGKRKICARFVPHALTTEQKQERVVYCQDLLLMGQDERLWENIITGDETWCFAYDRPPNDRLQSGWGKSLQNQRNCDLKKSRKKTNCSFRFVFILDFLWFWRLLSDFCPTLRQTATRCSGGIAKHLATSSEPRAPFPLPPPIEQFQPVFGPSVTLTHQTTYNG